MDLTTVGYALLGGILPSFIWLYFLLREDSRCPEPRKLIALAFVAGGAGVILVLPFEKAAAAYAGGGILFTAIWVPLIEELAKYLIAAFAILWRRAVDESVDYVVYMLTVALGFAALENALFLYQLLSHGMILGADGALATGNLRFIGSTLTHVLASSAIGFAMAFSYRKPFALRTLYGAIGLAAALGLHSLFNFLICGGTETCQPNASSYTLAAFFLVWTAALAFFALFEILKYFRYQHARKNVC